LFIDPQTIDAGCDAQSIPVLLLLRSKLRRLIGQRRGRVRR
jgi:hypothetical protein